MSSITFDNIHLGNKNSVEEACSILHAYLVLPPEVVGKMDNVLVRLSTPTPESEEVAAVEAAAVEAFHGVNSRPFLDAVLARIASSGSATLQEVCSDTGVPVMTARAYMRNARRTAKTRGAAFPFQARWSIEKGCTVYSPL